MDHITSESAKKFASSVYSVSLDSIQMALALTVALAWYAFVKGAINKLWPSREDKLIPLAMFAIIVTIIFTVVLAFVRKVLKQPISERPIMYAVTPGAM